MATTLAGFSCPLLALGKAEKIGSFICDSLSFDYFLKNKIGCALLWWLAKLVDFVWKTRPVSISFVTKIVALRVGQLLILRRGDPEYGDGAFAGNDNLA